MNLSTSTRSILSALATMVVILVVGSASASALTGRSVPGTAGGKKAVTIVPSKSRDLGSILGKMSRSRVRTNAATTVSIEGSSVEKMANNRAMAKAQVEQVQMTGVNGDSSYFGPAGTIDRD